MKVLFVSWEYPPVVVGGLGRHVHHLATEMAAAGHDVVVLTRRPSGTDAVSHPTTDTVVEGVRVLAVAEDPPEFEFGQDMMAWTLAMGHAFVRAGLRILHGAGSGASGPDPHGAGSGAIGSRWVPEVVHAHDWLVAHPAIALAEFFDVPLVSTIHATEAGRHSGWVSGRTNRQVHSVEWWLVSESDALITCSASMRDEVNRLFGYDATDITVIHNGIDIRTWPFAERARTSGPAELLFAGRLEYEKGVQDLLAALPRIRRSHPGTTLTIAGDGTQRDWLMEQARKHRVGKAVRFVGPVDHTELVTLMHRCDAIVLPSRYEPFGIVALEAAATGVPLIVTTAGGLGEAVREPDTGLTFEPADVAGLAAAVRATLSDPGAAAQRALRARARLTAEFSWAEVAERTASVHLAAKRRVRHAIGRPDIPERPLPERDSGQP
ncbi:glycosyltransferase family 4 protein [Gordonia hongkongensis]|uniref:Glycosyltransferase family 4 protein n=1 Tax=Gordonia hongkongensis TaxID=1701090 RepID=A0AAX3T3V8_9ACTN|nr:MULTISPECIES: glycosyltransferase family 4 protein [Gordonia]OCW86844.1 glycogen synthase [Nocardia farcinica]QIK47315.1 glycosyltransferase family 4 protein [Gordonia terrae]MBN0971970.1 glycosyltransferase family 4 protein [Gordonia sp. BP-119]MBN0982825.1 glycosyltransferase family 4 protein [Gordonia sp. BP-94]MDF6101614.1 glycosyltransferase family 4 protein [Gordonia hongkongensis]